MTVLIAPDSFKGSLTSVEVARALAAGWSRARPSDEVLLAPLADGGEGTLVAIEAAGGWEWREAPAHDPLGRPLAAAWLQSVDGRAAVVELAAASGLSRLTPAERDPAGASTAGTGEVLGAVLDAGVRTIIARDRRQRDDGRRRPASSERSGRRLATTWRLSTWPVSTRGSARSTCGSRATCQIPCSARTELRQRTGRRRARLRPMSACSTLVSPATPTRLRRATGRNERDTPGAGAAGGSAFGLLSLRDRFASIDLVPGIDLVMAAADFDGKLARPTS